MISGERPAGRLAGTSGFAPRRCIGAAPSQSFVDCAHELRRKSLASCPSLSGLRYGHGALDTVMKLPDRAHAGEAIKGLPSPDRRGEAMYRALVPGGAGVPGQAAVCVRIYPINNNDRRQRARESDKIFEDEPLGFTASHALDEE